MIAITRYGRRHWAVYLNHELVAVTVYKKGAVSVRNIIESALALASRSVLPATESISTAA